MKKIRALLVAVGVAVAMLIIPAAPAHAAYDEIKARGTKEIVLYETSRWLIKMKTKVQFGYVYTGDVNDDVPVAVRSWVQIRCWEKTGAGLQRHGCQKSIGLHLLRYSPNGLERIHQVHKQAAHQWEVKWQGSWKGYYYLSNYHVTAVVHPEYGFNGNTIKEYNQYTSYQAVP